MPLSQRDSCAALLLLLATACGGKSAVTSPTSSSQTASTFSLTGQVAENGSPTAIAGATVAIGDGPNAGRETTTDVAGTYRFTDLQSSGFTVTASADNYLSRSMGVTLLANQTLSFRLTRATSRVPPVAFELTGTAIDDSGKPRINASVYLDFVASDVPGTYFSHAAGVTDGTGFYRIGFAAVPGLMAHGMTAFACLRQEPDYAGDCQWIRATTHDVSQDFHPYLFRRIIAGESTRVTILPGDSVCVNNVQDFPGLGPDFVCRSVRIVAPTDGVITVDAQSLSGGARPPLEVEVVSGGGACCSERLANPTSISVTKGAEIVANVEMLWGTTAAQAVILNTTLEQP